MEGGTIESGTGRACYCGYVVIAAGGVVTAGFEISRPPDSRCEVKRVEVTDTAGQLEKLMTTCKE